MDRQVEYEIRRDMYNLNNKKIEEEFNKIEHKLISFTGYELICYSLLSIENGFRNGAFTGDNTYKDAASKRTIIEWFFKRLLTRKIAIKEFQFDQNKYNKFESNLPEIFMLCGNYLLNEQLNKMRGINKILIEENENNEYIFKLPSIKDKIDCQDTYYWGKSGDLSQAVKEACLKNEATKKITDKYFKRNPTRDDHINLRKFIFLEKIDLEVYNACKDNVRVDIDKVGIDFSSEIIKDKQQLINILAVFMYLSKISIFKDTLLDLRGNPLFKVPIIYNKEDLIKIIKRFLDITYDEINNIIDYFTIGSQLMGGINEYPLVNIKNNILWVPSSFIMNDFQFSIVNGHYEKSIKIKKRDSTVSQSVVDNIVTKCKNYKNIIVSNNKVYFDKLHKFNGGDLKSDIDVALYDEISNSLLIIECKWKENVFLKGEKYDQICDAVSQIYNKQLYKHKYFLELNEQNLDLIFNNNERVKNRPYFPQVLYVFVDKRIQLHCEGKHALSEFNLLKVLNDNSSGSILRLDKVNSYINTLSTEVEYSKKDMISLIKLNGRVIKNNIFTLTY
ncbi:hypothetical protein [Clostridium carboxidivorans]|nr:hypothetical protein [Clostridium carboxidivorans]EFG90190.1 hypothetical protein CLCAR_0396 [Clostridium carboxidivorans P7]